MKVNYLAPKQAWTIQGKQIVFQSYDTVVCIIENWEHGNNPVIKITPGQPQSQTTAKYLNMFLKLHTPFNNYKNI
jgi:hypothetical protein